MIDTQIIQMQASPEKAKIEELRRLGKAFLDDKFPPNNNSLCGEWRNVSEWSDVRWAKLSDKIKNQVVFYHKPDPRDIRQGYLGDCYFLAGLAALAEKPDRIFNLFLVN